MIRRYLGVCCLELSLLIGGWLPLIGHSFSAQAAVWSLEEGQDIVGSVRWHRISEADTMVSIARRYGLGYEAIVRANPIFDVWLPQAHRYIQLPLEFILPPGPRKGLVLNLAEMRLYYYPEDTGGRVFSYPVGIGREGWETPVTTTRITTKVADPVWYPPASIREEALARGILLPEMVPAGPANPLGSHALRLALPSYLLHGTNRPAGVGMRVSHGCIRLYPEDIVALFEQVEVGTSLRIIDEPYKLGWKHDQLFLEVNHAGSRQDEARGQSIPVSLQRALSSELKNHGVQLDTASIWSALDDASGVPVAIGKRKVPQP